jgi:hypothetical protein
MSFGGFISGGGGVGKAKVDSSTGNIKLGNDAGALFSSDDNDNVAIGTSSLNSTTTDSNNNVAIGTNALTACETGDGNIGIGKDAGSSMEGSNNVCIGTEAGEAIIGANDNVAIGTNALKTNATGTSNVVIGKDSYKLGDSSSIVCIGANAAENHASSSPVSSKLSVIIGMNAMTASTQTLMQGCVIIGGDAVKNEATFLPWEHTVVGVSSMVNATTGTHNTTLGAATADSITTAVGCTVIGSYVDTEFADENGQLVIGTFPSGTGTEAVSIIKRKSALVTMTGSYTNANQDNKAAQAKLFTIPAYSFISRVIARVKTLGAGTHNYNVSLGTASDEASGDTVAGRVELLGAGSGSTAVTRTQGSQDAHSDINASSGGTDETLYISEISPGTDDSVGWCGALRYVYLCHAGTSNSTTDPGTDPVIEVIVEYY